MYTHWDKCEKHKKTHTHTHALQKKIYEWNIKTENRFRSILTNTDALSALGGMDVFGAELPPIAFDSDIGIYAKINTKKTCFFIFLCYFSFFVFHFSDFICHSM